MSAYISYNIDKECKNCFAARIMMGLGKVKMIKKLYFNAEVSYSNAKHILCELDDKESEQLRRICDSKIRYLSRKLKDERKEFRIPSFKKLFAEKVFKNVKKKG